MKLGWHFQQIPDWAGGLVNSKYVKIIDPPEQNPFPGQRTIGRIFIGDELERQLVSDGASGALQYWYLVLPFYKSRPWVWAWEGPNEPDMATEEAITNLVDFTRRLGEMMRENKFRSVGLNLSVGWPQLEHAWRFEYVFPALDYIGLHEYSAPTMQHSAGHLCLRYRQTYAQWKPHSPPPLLIGECGIDGGVISQPRKGWKTFANESQFANQLEWYSTELERDDFVEAAFIFTSGPHQDWVDFDFNEHLSGWLCDALADDECLEDFIAEEMQQHMIPYFKGHAFDVYGRQHPKWEPRSPEVDMSIGQVQTRYRCQVWLDPATQMQHILYCLVGHWHDIRVIDKEN